MRGHGPSDHDDHGRTTRDLAGIVVVLVVVVTALVVIRKLQVRSILTECVAAQQPACGATVERLRVSRLIDLLWDFRR